MAVVLDCARARTKRIMPPLERDKKIERCLFNTTPQKSENFFRVHLLYSNDNEESATFAKRRLRNAPTNN